MNAARRWLFRLVLVISLVLFATVADISAKPNHSSPVRSLSGLCAGSQRGTTSHATVAFVLERNYYTDPRDHFDAGPDTLYAVTLDGADPLSPSCSRRSAKQRFAASASAAADEDRFSPSERAGFQAA